ncbi:MAG TPA: SDR family NAD(P)-dependent oxidoreductase [Solirubrobacteraceae bacterium]|nr:SDR family NAD(P)-dependent oxidoreductase [Solirubrobacteraceae bacterium]
MGRVALHGARVLLTGASGGVGQALARRLAEEGSQLVLTGRRADVLETLASEVGGRAIVADLALREDVARLVESAGEVDVLIANAALAGSGRLESLDVEHIERAIAVNLRAPAVLAQAVAPAMAARGRGQLVFIGSLSGKAPSGGAAVYSATKAGLRALALGLRMELAPAGIGVSLVSPGFIASAGMYADTAIKLPRGMSAVPMARVIDAIIRAIESDRGEIDVASLPMRVGADVANLAPGLAARVGRVIGASDLALQFEERQSEKR